MTVRVAVAAREVSLVDGIRALVVWKDEEWREEERRDTVRGDKAKEDILRRDEV